MIDEFVKVVNIIICGDTFGFFLDFVGNKYPGELVLIAELKKGTDVEDADKESSTESSGVRGVVEK